MNSVELNLVRSLKLLWSFIWRVWVLMVPLMVVMVVFMVVMMPRPKLGEPPQPMDPKQLPGFFLLWLLLMSGGLVAQALALRWALKAEWSDFRIVVVSPKPRVEQAP